MTQALIETMEGQVDRLANFIMAEVPGEPSQNAGAIDTAIRIIRTQQADALRQAGEAERLREALDSARHAIDRDRYIVAYCITEIEQACRVREWTLDGRGPYEWDDDGYQKEFGTWLDEVRASMVPLKAVAWDKSDCDNVEDRVIAAKAAAKKLLEKPRRHREMIEADLLGDPRDRRIAELEAALKDKNDG